MKEPAKSPAEVRVALRDLAQPVAQDLRRSMVQCETRRLSGLAGPTLFFPVVYLLAVVLLAPLGIDLRLSLLVAILLTLLVPLTRIWLRWQAAKQLQVATSQALVKIDHELQLADRMSTAHEFVEVAEPDGFQLAAIRDAHDRIAAARAAQLRRPVVVSDSPRRLLLAALLALLLLWGAGLVPVASGSVGIQPVSQQQVTALPTKPVAAGSEVEPSPLPEPQPTEQVAKRKTELDAATASPSDDEAPSDESRRGKNPIGSGASAEAQAAAGGGSERGQPSNQAQSTKGQQAQKQKPKNKSDKQRDDDKQAEEQDKPPQESGSTLGRGSGKGSSKSPTASPWSAKDQVVSDDEQDPEDDEEVDDENDESKARGGVQPNLRQRKPPVNRDLQISMGSGKPQDDANGRGGPGGPTKQRGVAQLVLGVTFPDHISAKPNPGMSKITQERIEPQAQQGDQVPGEDRGQRAAPMGHLSRRVLTPWMQDLVRSFYLGLRKEGGPQ